MARVRVLGLLIVAALLLAPVTGRSDAVLRRGVASAVIGQVHSALEWRRDCRSVARGSNEYLLPGIRRLCGRRCLGQRHALPGRSGPTR
jgi:hypothetical protein